jgi:hypothetical protein
MNITKLYVFLIILFFSCNKSETNVVDATVNNLVPTLSSMQPSTAISGGASFTITINGTNFINGSIIKWNGTSLPTTYISSTQLTATVLAANIVTAGNASINVFTTTPGGGTSVSLNFVVTAAVVNNPIPTLSSISPNTVVTGSPAFTLNVMGTNFVINSVVAWNGGALITTYISATQLKAAIPSSYIFGIGNIGISVYSPAPGGGNSSSLPLAITP